jgi:hypothetical protein
VAASVVFSVKKSVPSVCVFARPMKKVAGSAAAPAASPRRVGLWVTLNSCLGTVEALKSHQAIVIELDHLTM